MKGIPTHEHPATSTERKTSMIRKLLFTAGLALTVGLTACQNGGADEPEAQVTTSPPPPPATEPAELAFTPPEDFATIAIFDIVQPLSPDYLVNAYRMDGADTEELIVVASYLLPQDLATATREEREAIVMNYDEVIGNEDVDGIVNVALVGGQQGLYRWARVTVDDETVFQANTFLFSGNQAIMVTCQYVEQRPAVDSACEQVLESLEFPENWQTV